jgi:hypothetical protein
MGDAEVTEFLPARRPHGNSSSEARLAVLIRTTC